MIIFNFAGSSGPYNRKIVPTYIWTHKLSDEAAHQFLSKPLQVFQPPKETAWHTHLFPWNRTFQHHWQFWWVPGTLLYKDSPHIASANFTQTPHMCMLFVHFFFLHYRKLQQGECHWNKPKFMRTYNQTLQNAREIFYTTQFKPLVLTAPENTSNCIPTCLLFQKLQNQKSH